MKDSFVASASVRPAPNSVDAVVGLIGELADKSRGDDEYAAGYRLACTDIIQALPALAAPAATGGEALREAFARIAEAQVSDAVGKDDASKCYRMACHDCAEAIRAAPLTHPAPSETGASLGVKELEWAKDGSVWFAHGGFGQGYQIYTHGADGVHRVMFSWSTKLWDLQASTLDEAKAAAQADYETRIRAAMEGRSDD